MAPSPGRSFFARPQRWSRCFEGPWDARKAAKAALLCGATPRRCGNRTVHPPPSNCLKNIKPGSGKGAPEPGQWHEQKHACSVRMQLFRKGSLKPDRAASVHGQHRAGNELGSRCAQIHRRPAYILRRSISIHGCVSQNLLLPGQILIHYLMEHGRIYEPGTMALTRIPSRERSPARQRVIPSSADLAAPYTLTLVNPSSADSEEINTTLPCSLAFI